MPSGRERTERHLPERSDGRSKPELLQPVSHFAGLADVCNLHEIPGCATAGSLHAERDTRPAAVWNGAGESWDRVLRVPYTDNDYAGPKRDDRAARPDSPSLFRLADSSH